MTFQKLAVVGITSLMLAGCTPGDQVGRGATYENSAQIVTMNMSDGRSLDCLSGPWTNTIWYDDGVLKEVDGSSVAEDTTLDRVADHTCRQYFTVLSRGISEDTAVRIARDLYDELTG